MVTEGLRQLHAHCDPLGSYEMYLYMFLYFLNCLPILMLLFTDVLRVSETLQEILQMSLLTAMLCILLRNTILTSSDSECSTEPLALELQSFKSDLRIVHLSKKY